MYKVTDIQRGDVEKGESDNCLFVIESDGDDNINEPVRDAVISWLNVFCESVRVVDFAERKLSIEVTHPFVSSIYENFDEFLLTLSL